MDLLNLARAEITDKDIKKLLAADSSHVGTPEYGILTAVLLVTYILWESTIQNDTVARLLHVLAAVGIFLYQTLDALDGKQARRINAKSPLGQILTLCGSSFSTAAFWIHWGVFILKIADVSVLGLLQVILVVCYYLKSGTKRKSESKSPQTGDLVHDINWDVLFLGICHLICCFSPEFFTSVRILDWQARYWVLTMLCRHLLTQAWTNVPSNDSSALNGKFKIFSKIPYAVIYWLVPLLMFSVQSINTVVPFGLIATILLAGLIHLRLQIKVKIGKPAVLHPRQMLVLLIVPLLGSFIKQTMEKHVIDGFWMAEIIIVVASYLYQLGKMAITSQ